MYDNQTTHAPELSVLPTGKCQVKRRASLKARPRGQSTVEFSLIALVLFIILFATIDYAQIYFYNNSLQNALREATRFATAGRIIQASNGGLPVYETNNGVTVPKAINDSEGREASRNECIRYWFLSNCVITLPLSNIVIISAASPAGDYANTTNSGANLLNSTNGSPVPGPGNANDYVQVTATYNLHTITPIFSYLGMGRPNNSVYPVRVSAIVKNEPALLNFQHNAIYSDEP